MIWAIAFLALTGTETTTQTALNAVRLIDRIKPGMTLADCKRVLPKGTRCGKPVWYLDSDYDHGNAIRLSGKTIGTLVFRRAAQLKQMESQSLNKNQRLAIDKTFKPSDPVFEVYADLENWKSYSKSKGRACLDRVIRVLGKPKSIDFDPKWINSGGGWFAAFVRHGRLVVYWEQGWRDAMTGNWSYSSSLEATLARKPFSKG